jgi:predicted TIM-barrel fold metal-dependent hydrolase
MVEAIALPSGLKSLAGRLNDVDSHEMMPCQMWTEVYGADVKEIADAVAMTSLPWEKDNNSHNVPDWSGDVLEITDALMLVKGPKAPGAVDLKRRHDVMDAMGVRRQLMYPTGLGGWAMTLYMQDKYDPQFLSHVKGDRKGKSKRWLKTYNEWFVQTANMSDRVRTTPFLMGDTVPELMAEAHRMLKAGVRAVFLSPSLPPGGKSPAHPDLEPFWALMEEANCVVTLHLGTEAKFWEHHKVWRDAPVFEGYRDVGEFSMDPWYTANVHYPSQQFLQTAIMGGVFVRHPNLRFGVIECAAYWVGPMMETLDMWYRNLAAFAVAGKRLPELPSTYLKSNVRVSTFPWEDLGMYIDRYGLEDVICFASDYPHIEGGKDMITQMYNKVAPYGDKVLEKYFVTNGAFLLPD